MEGIPQLIISLLTLAGTLIIAYNTNKLNRTTKYIETVTSERIEWIKEFRSEVSEIIAYINNIDFLYSEYIKKAKELTKNTYIYEDYIKREQSKRFFGEQYSNLGTMSFYTDQDYENFENEIKNWKESANFINTVMQKENIRKKIWHLILKLNPDDEKDNRTQDLFEDLIGLLNIDKIKLQELNETKKELIKEVKKMLKNEWERVKEETGGRRRKQKWFW